MWDFWVVQNACKKCGGEKKRGCGWKTRMFFFFIIKKGGGSLHCNWSMDYKEMEFKKFLGEGRRRRKEK